VFDIRAQDRPLIAAALRLGDWLARHPDTTASQREAIPVLREALRRLPQESAGLDVSYGCRVEWYTEAARMDRSWTAALDPIDGLQFFSIYSPWPGIEPWEQSAHELDFRLDPSAANTHDGYYYVEWVAEVSDPDQFRRPGCTFEVNVCA
jgi:hypothetical protein